MGIKKIVLAGNPNSGKSAIFSRLTNVDAISSNYPGTTVEITKGILKTSNERYEIIDSPGIYSFSILNVAEEVANKTIDEADIIINILDSTNLERSLNLTLQLIKKQKPIVVVLNFWDETKHRGIEIDALKLQEILGLPVIPTCAISGDGIKDLVEKLNEAKVSKLVFEDEKKWEKIGEILLKVQKVFHRKHTFSDKLSEISINPTIGIPIAFFVLIFSFIIIRFLGEGLINYFFDPIFNRFYLPFILKLNTLHIPVLLKEIFLGKTGEVMNSFGILTTGLYIPFVIVLPYILSFYAVLSFLEDSGYLPRLSVLLDTILHKIGIHGYSSIPIILGFGCKVPALFSIRILESEREKIITAALVLITAPCMPQTAMIFALGMQYGIKVVILIFILLFTIAIMTSHILNKILKGEAQELFLEIPAYRLPVMNIYIKKLWIRIKSFFFEASPLIIFGVFLINLMELAGIIDFLAKIFGKPFKFLTGMPEEITSVMLLGFLRKDVSISMLAPFSLSAKQFIIASVFMVLYLPCIASFFTLIKELGFKRAFKVIFLIFLIAFSIAFLLNIILN